MALRADHVDLDRDRALVERFQAGDDAAFDELYRRYRERLERFCLKRVGDPDTAEEVAQEAFTRALAALPNFGGERHFYPWVSVIASRLCVDHHRRLARTPAVSTLDPAGVTGGQDEIVDAVDDAIVLQAMARLGPRHQDVLRLREVNGWSYCQIADHYAVPVGTVETLLFRARRALRREFRVIDGAGLVGIPVVGWLFQLLARARDRLPNQASIAGAPPALGAAAAAATVAAMVVIPGAAPRPPARAAPPAVTASTNPTWHRPGAPVATPTADPGHPDGSAAAWRPGPISSAAPGAATAPNPVPSSATPAPPSLAAPPLTAPPLLGQAPPLGQSTLLGQSPLLEPSPPVGPDPTSPVVSMLGPGQPLSGLGPLPLAAPAAISALAPSGLDPGPLSLPLAPAAGLDLASPGPPAAPLGTAASPRFPAAGPSPLLGNVTTGSQ